MISIPLDPVLVWIMVFLRTSFLLAFFPLFGEGFVPLWARIVLSGVIALALAPVAPLTADQFPTTVGAMVAMTGSEALLGFSVGLIGRAMFAVVQFSGQIGGEQIGFGLINTIDPTSSHQISVIAELQYLLSVLVFLTSGLHHVFFAAMAASFDSLPPGTAVLSSGVGAFFIQLGGAVFSLAVRFAMPVIAVVFIINVAMAMIGRAVPQINVFLESFPLRIIGGLLVVMASLPLLVRLWLVMFSGMESLFAELFSLLQG